MKIAVAKEIDPSEPRVAAPPDMVKKIQGAGRRCCGRAGRRNQIRPAGFALHRGRRHRRCRCGEGVPTSTDVQSSGC
jgi:hypothetical protein